MNCFPATAFNRNCCPDPVSCIKTSDEKFFPVCGKKTKRGLCCQRSVKTGGVCHTCEGNECPNIISCLSVKPIARNDCKQCKRKEPKEPEK